MEKKVRVKDIQMNYRVVGQGKPAIIIHGYVLDHVTMTSCLEPVFGKNDGYKRIYIDLPGMGKSESADWIVNSDMMLELVVAFIKKVISNESFLLIGYSYGGYLSQGVLNKMPNRVTGLLLMCPVVIADRNKRSVPENVVLQKDEAFLSSLSTEVAEGFDSMMVIQTENTHNRFKGEILESAEKADYKFLEHLQNNGYGFSFDINIRYDKPTLFLLGRQDSCVGYKDAWKLLDNFPRATFSVLDKAGHNLQIEQDALFELLLTDWIKRTEKG
jgi:pimeloyl-ACP methyl ester carboxylesterase